MSGLRTKESKNIVYMVMEENLENEEEIISMHPNEDLAINAMLERIDEYKKDNPYATILPTKRFYGDYTASGVVWWRIKRFQII